MTTNTIIEALEGEAARLTDELVEQEDAEVAVDLDAEITETEEALVVAQAEESAAAGVADEAEHHRLMDRVRWLTAKLERLRSARSERLAEEAERRRREAILEADRLLTEAHPLSDVVSAYRSAEQALDALVAACKARDAALVDAARVLHRGGVQVGNTSRPSVTLPSGLHTVADVNAGQVVAELVIDVAGQHRLVTDGNTQVVSLLSRSISRTSRGRVARLAARQDA